MDPTIIQSPLPWKMIVWSQRTARYATVREGEAGRAGSEATPRGEKYDNSFKVTGSVNRPWPPNWILLVSALIRQGQLHFYCLSYWSVQLIVFNIKLTFSFYDVKHSNDTDFVWNIEQILSPGEYFTRKIILIKIKNFHENVTNFISAKIKHVALQFWINLPDVLNFSESSSK